MTEAITLLPLARIEGIQLARLVDEFRGLLSTAPTDDPAVHRLVPDAYPGDPEASAAFAEGTRDELLDRREQDAAVVRAALDRFLVSSADDDELAPLDAVIPDAAMPAWLRTLAAMRLVIASRLGIVDENDSDSDDPSFAVYHWLGYRLEGLVTAASS